jgi:hypothetical protein
MPVDPIAHTAAAIHLIHTRWLIVDLLIDIAEVLYICVGPGEQDTNRRGHRAKVYVYDTVKRGLKPFTGIFTATNSFSLF